MDSTDRRKRDADGPDDEHALCVLFKGRHNDQIGMKSGGSLLEKTILCGISEYDYHSADRWGKYSIKQKGSYSEA